MAAPEQSHAPAEAFGDDRTREELLDVILKAIDTDPSSVAASNQRTREDEAFKGLDVLPNPFPPELMVLTYERSSALRPCVDAIVTNVHGFGHRWVPTINIDAADASRVIAESILAERLFDGDDTYPTDAEIDEKRQEIERGIQVDRLRMRTFMRGATKDGFIDLRKQLGNDYEITGNAYIEVLRDAAGRVAQLVYAPATTMRLRPMDPKLITIQRRIRISDIAFGEVERRERFRTFVQRINGSDTHFKEFGDPRVMSSKSGRFVDRVEDLNAGDAPATEIIHYRIPSPRSSYGIPRWIGATFEVLGIRAASEVNYLIFDQKSIPPFAILVSGGTLTPGADKQIAAHIKARVQGRQNYHSALILEALPPAGAGDPAAAGRIRIELKPLAQPQDGTHLVYADMSEDVVARQFRLSPITRGKTKDFNKSTASASMQKDEQQIFQPERTAFDERFERTILTDLGIRYVKLESNSPAASDAEILAGIIGELVEKGVLTPEDARPFVGSILNTELPPIDADWVKQPLALTLAGIPVQRPDEGGDDTSQPVKAKANLAQQLIALRDQLSLQRAREFSDAQNKSRLEEAEVIHVDPAVMGKWVIPAPTLGG